MNIEKEMVNELTTVALRDMIATGKLKSVDLNDFYLKKISERESEIKAWTWHDPKFVQCQAESLDERKSSRRKIGRLHGLPVGLKDVFDTAKIPTENGSPLDKGRIPEKDCWVAKRLKAEGAVLMGKSVTTELAYLDPGKTKNPFAIDHTPGGSSSGSAAAVASGMVPLAIGNQIGGSVIRPAAYCGITGYKPSYGLIPRTGMLNQSPSMNTVGVFGRRPEDCALLAEALFGYDENDTATNAGPLPQLLEMTMTEPPATPSLVFVEPPGWENVDDETRTSFNKLREFIGNKFSNSIKLPRIFNDAEKYRKIVSFSEMALYLNSYYQRDSKKLGAKLSDALETGGSILAKDYLFALDWRNLLKSSLSEIFKNADAIVTPSSPTPAPKGLESTGNGIFNGVWTFAGVPAVTIPCFLSSNGLPMGIQLIGNRGSDGSLLRNARWILTKIENSDLGNRINPPF